MQFGRSPPIKIGLLSQFGHRFPLWWVRHPQGAMADLKIDPEDGLAVQDLATLDASQQMVAAKLVRMVMTSSRRFCAIGWLVV